MRITGSNRLAVPERLWIERPLRRRIPCYPLLFILGLILIGGGIASLRVHAAPAAAPMEKAEPKGGLFLRRPDGTMLDAPAPAVDTVAKIDIAGVIARVTVTQTFRNPDSGWVEGVYVFPLSRKGAVDHMVMRIGARVVEGRIEERQAAKRHYEAARNSGRKAGLVEQERPNIFTASVANIPPGGTIAVEISYQQPVDIQDGLYSLRFPMVVNPRYIPEGPQVAGVGGAGIAANTATVPDAERITPPMRHPALPRENPVRIAVHLAPGMAVTGLRSLYHKVSVAEPESGDYRLELADGPVPADSDFVIEWRPQAGSEPKAALFQEQQAGGTYLLAMVVPPQRAATGDLERLPREVVFVIDTSGSMHGQSILQARQALRLAVDRLTPADRFNIIGFASTPTALFAAPRQANARAITEARRFIAGLRAAGGTEMRRALDLALDEHIDSGRLRQIVLLTDGSVGNETALFRAIRRGIGDSRLFTVGIGSAPNGYFMSRAARFGRGTFTFIGKTDEVGEKMSALFAKLGEPLMTDIVMTLPDERDADIQPGRIPDLYAGEPIVVSARTAKAEGDLVVSGRFGTKPWSTRLALPAATAGSGVAKLWARRKVETLMDRRQEGVAEDEVRAAVLTVALPHQIMSRYTSLVAIDKPISRPAGDALTAKAVPTNPIKGWTPPSTSETGVPGTKDPLRRAQGASVQQLAQAASPGVTIGLHARTATPAQRQLILGLLLVLLAVATLVVHRRWPS